MVLWIGLDDTDSVHGMCTTFLATEVILELAPDYDLIGHPRLVRLNPNIPWKTRGNGAIALAVGRGHGRRHQVGSVGGQSVYAYSKGTVEGDGRQVLNRVARVVERWSELSSEGTDPGLVVLTRKPSPRLYWQAVRGIVSKQEALTAIKGLGWRREWKLGRGVIGAAAACAWKPRDRTWEVLAYRDRDRWGSVRNLDPASVRRMDRRYPSTFSNYDYENERVVIAPRTPCPVLLGIRGERARELPAAMRTIRGERPERWIVFLSNQGTDDHIDPQGQGRPLSGSRYAGTVSHPPRTLPGGHVVFGLGAYDVSVYEPAKQFRAVARSLIVGDRVEVIGSLRKSPRTINAEKLHLVSLAVAREKIANPRCPLCGHRMKSMGRNAAFRCRWCGTRARREEAIFAPAVRSIVPDWYEPPAGSRRHLCKPLKRSSGLLGSPPG